jgi:protein-S-isoprenylcysteine O-methyltransferase Ste14
VTALRAWAILATIAAAVTLLLAAFGGDFLHETLGLRWKSIRVFVMLLVVVVAIVVLWRAMLRDGARRPDGSDSRKNSKQRS